MTRSRTCAAAERSQDIVTADDARSRADAATARRDAAADRRGSEQDRDGSATDRVEATEEIDAASLDALTATYARGPGMAELERDRSRADRAGEPMTLAFIDVDGLEGINDRAGHPAGDRLLRQVADVLRENMRPHDVIVR